MPTAERAAQRRRGYRHRHANTPTTVTVPPSSVTLLPAARCTVQPARVTSAWSRGPLPGPVVDGGWRVFAEYRGLLDVLELPAAVDDQRGSGQRWDVAGGQDQFVVSHDPHTYVCRAVAADVEYVSRSQQLEQYRCHVEAQRSNDSPRAAERPKCQGSGEQFHGRTPPDDSVVHQPSSAAAPSGCPCST